MAGLLVSDVALSWCAARVPVIRSRADDSADERRNTRRYPCLLRARVEWGQGWPTVPAQVRNISEGGLGLLMGGRRPSDAAAVLEVFDRTGNRYALVQGRITWAEALQTGLWEAGWQVVPPLDMD